MLDAEQVRRQVRAALDEDMASADVTTLATVPEGLRARGTLLAGGELILAGLEVTEAAFRTLDPDLRWEPQGRDGDRFFPGTVLAFARGRARALLAAERVALNFLRRMCGVATLTRRYVDAVAGTPAQVRDTRKTAPLLRAFDRHAVQAGGGLSRREGLDTGLLVKTNHVRLAGSLRAATLRALAGADGRAVEVELTSPDEVEEALRAGAQALLLDSSSVEDVREAVRRVDGRVPVEVSGAIGLDTVRDYAEAGVDFIAVGALTDSAPAADVTLEVEPA